MNKVFIVTILEENDGVYAAHVPMVTTSLNKAKDKMKDIARSFFNGQLITEDDYNIEESELSYTAWSDYNDYSIEIKIEEKEIE